MMSASSTLLRPTSVPLSVGIGLTALVCGCSGAPVPGWLEPRALYTPNTWLHWRSRYDTFEVQLENDRVIGMRN